jgi:hypothetical protein
LVASAREDLRREDCAVIVLDPKGDAAEGEQRQAVGILADSVQFLAARQRSEQDGDEVAEEQEPVAF